MLWQVTYSFFPPSAQIISFLNRWKAIHHPTIRSFHETSPFSSPNIRRETSTPILTHRVVTAYLDSTCSMPTSQALTTTNSPCYFLGPSELIGSYRARCTTTTDNNNNPPSSTSIEEPIPSSKGEGEGKGKQGEAHDDQHSDTISEIETESASTPDLQSTLTSGASTALPASRDTTWHGWADVSIRALVAMGALDVAWG